MAFGKDTDPNVGASTQFKPGESGNPNGVPKGTKHLATFIREAMEDDNFEFWKTHPIEGVKKYKQMPAEAIVTVAIEKAAAGDTKWADWLGKYGYGSKLELANNPENPIVPVHTTELAAQYAEFLKTQA